MGKAMAVKAQGRRKGTQLRRRGGDGRTAVKVQGRRGSSTPSRRREGRRSNVFKAQGREGGSNAVKAQRRGGIKRFS